MEKRHFAILLALIACAPAEAGPQHGPKHGPAASHSGGRNGGGAFTPVLLIDNASRYAVLRYGQSRAGSTGSASAVSTSQPYSNSRATGTTLAALVETTNETDLSSVINQITSIRASQNDLLGFSRSLDGQTIANLSIGTGTYNQLVTQSLDMRTGAASGCITAVVLSQGESDTAAGTTTDAWMASVLQLRLDLEASFLANGSLCPQGLVLFIEQTPGWTGYSATDAQIPLAQLALHRLRNHRVYLLDSVEGVPYTDGAHSTALGHQESGMILGEGVESLWSGIEKEPLAPRTIIRNGNVAQIYFIVPCLRTGRCSDTAGIEWDIAGISDRTYPSFTFGGSGSFNLGDSEGMFYGFRYLELGSGAEIGIRPRITSVAIISAAACTECAADERRVDVTLSSPPRTTGWIGYRDVSQTGGTTGCNSAHGLGAGCEASGNLRDFGNLTPWTGAYSGKRRAAIFRDQIVGASAPAQLSQVSNTVALSVGAGSDYWDVPSATITGADVNNLTTKFSFFMLRNFSTQTTNNIIISKGLGAAGAFFLKQSNTNDLTWQFSTTSNSTSCSGCDLSTSVTYCLAGSYDGARPTGVDRARLYVGRPNVSWTKPTQNQTGTIPASMIVDTNPLRVGYVNTNPGHVGDEEMLWFNAALTSSQLMAICNSYTSSGALIGDVENTIDLTVPSAWYRHDGDVGTTVTDAIAGTFNGTTHGTLTQVGAMAP